MALMKATVISGVVTESIFSQLSGRPTSERGKLEEVDGDVLFAGEGGGSVDGGLDAGGVESCGDDGDMNSLAKGEEPGDVCHGNKVALGHHREEEYVNEDKSQNP